MKLYHVASAKHAKQYRVTEYIRNPVRGFTTIEAALAWACKVERKVIYEVTGEPCYKLPDHHNRFGEAWWIDNDVTQFVCVFSAEKDA